MVTTMQRAPMTEHGTTSSLIARKELRSMTRTVSASGRSSAL